MTASPPPADLVATGTAGVMLPPGPAGDAAEAVARARAGAPSGAPARSPASPPAADDVAGPAGAPRRDLPDVGARLKRALPALAAAALVAGIVIWRARR
jgi:hypothetical protein